ncbi:MarR family winged helix-turn-helix transcriptional regulator [Metabacillus idriensis]|uniref:MarR family winged helix-turn-helix transcriptional regulator n=1 Tax=Metabacillus idriensis TaxID=324768 RepID=UPI00174D0A1E|nr:MarR family transcriptional regulator [Metabacillus idriensis]
MDKNDMCVHFLLGKALQKASQVTKSKLNSYGITPVQFAVLRQLWISDGQLGSKLGDRLQMDSATMTGILDRMEQKEFVQRQSDPRDRRHKIVYLTEKGREMEDPLNQKMEEWNKELMTGFNEDDIQTFKRMLTTIGFRNIHQG